MFGNCWAWPHQCGYWRGRSLAREPRAAHPWRSGEKVDLAGPGMRQRGIQEIDGVELLRSITKASLRIDQPAQLDAALEAVRLGSTPRRAQCS